MLLKHTLLVLKSMLSVFCIKQFMQEEVCFESYGEVPANYLNILNSLCCIMETISGFYLAKLQFLCLIAYLYICAKVITLAFLISLKCVDRILIIDHINKRMCAKKGNIATY